MKSNKKILGIPIALFVIGILVVGGASAALVSYLSNTATIDVDVASPMTVQFAEDTVSDLLTLAPARINNVAGIAAGDWVNDLTVTTTGLSTVELGVKVNNNADVDIVNKKLILTISDDLVDVTCADLTSLTFIDVGASSASAYYQVVQELAGIGLCSELAGVVTYTIPINSLTAGQEFLYPATMTFGNVIPQGYAITATMEI